MKTPTLKLFVFFFSFFALFADASAQDADVRISTEYGDMLVKLYDETPQHRDNFMKLVSEGFYDSLLFHRVIKDFMIQGGDPKSKNAESGEPLGNGGLEYLVPAEIHPHLYHKKGVLAAARQSDAVNPEKKSSACQFYIVQGKISPPHILKSMESRQNRGKAEDEQFTYSPEAIEDYNTIGGAPHLDGSYTVFGEVVKGLDIIDKIAAAEVDGRSRPIEDIIMKIEPVN